jgi:pentatricopeptide repeat protein
MQNVGMWKMHECLFEKMHERSIVSWNAMIAAYARCGDQVEAMDLYGQMQWMAMKPNEFTLASVVSACKHDGFRIWEGNSWTGC